MSKRTDLLYFGRMLDEARTIERSLAKAPAEAELTSDEVLLVAVAHRLEVIARMAQKVSTEGRRAHPEIDWHEIERLRDKINRDEYHVVPERVWEAATINIPPLLAALSSFVPSEPPRNGSKT